MMTVRVNKQTFAKLSPKSITRLLLTVLAGLCCTMALAIDMKVDRVTINQLAPPSTPIAWLQVNFQQTYSTTPVVIVTATTENPDPATARIRNVTTTGFEVGIVEPQGADGATTATVVDYFVAELGTYTFPGGQRMVVGTLTTAGQVGSRVGQAWSFVTFPSSAFNNSPAVVGQVQTINSQPGLDAGILGEPWLDVAIRNVTDDDMQIALDRSKTNTGTVTNETIGYIAMESGDSFTLGGAQIQALLTPTNIEGVDDAGCFSNSFVTSFANAPRVVASKNTANGGDFGWIRRCAISANSVGLVMDEDESDGSNRSHGADESAGVLAFDSNFFGQRNGRGLEGGSVTVPAAVSSTTQWTQVNFPNAFNDVPVIFTLPTDASGEPTNVRVRNASINGFEIAGFSPDGSNPPATQMTVDYVAVVPGTHTTTSGDTFEVVQRDVSARVGRNDGTGDSFASQNFSSSFSSAPAVITQIQSNNNEPGLEPNLVSSPWMTVAMRNLNSNSMQWALDRAETRTGTVNTNERIAYFAVSNGTNGQLTATDNNTVDFEMLLSNDSIRGWDNGCFSVPFAETYSSPLVTASQNTRDGGDGGWVRRCDQQSNRVGLAVDEDTSSDSERAHTTERASVFVFSRAFEADFSGPSGPDHYNVAAPGNTIACSPFTVTVEAHDIGDTPVDGQGATVTLDTGTNRGTWSGAGVTDNGDGTASVAFASGASSVNATLLYSQLIGATESITITASDGSINSLENAAVTVALSGFEFGTGNFAAGIPNQVAGVSDNSLRLRAVNTGPDGSCVPLNPNQSLSVEFSSSYINPTAGAGVSATIGGQSIASSAAVTLNFDGNSIADIPNFNYNDVGRLQLQARNNTGATPIAGDSNSFVVRPHHFDITVSANPGTTTSGSGFIAAGATFAATVTARTGTNDIAPNYGNEALPESVAVNIGSLVMPVGGDIGNLSGGTASGGNGTFTVSGLSWDNVGTITLLADVADNSYLGAGPANNPQPSGNVGRFFPADFALTSDNTNNGCGSFTYLGQPNISVSYNLEARNISGATTSNYAADSDGVTATANYPVATISHNAQQGAANLSNRLVIDSTEWVNGVYTLNTPAAAINRQASSAPDGPFSAVQLSLAENDNDADISGSSDIGSPLNLRFGRAFVSDTHGPESTLLNVPFGTEYWDGNRFTASLTDSCSVIAVDQIRFNNAVVSTSPQGVDFIGGAGTDSNGTFFFATPNVQSTGGTFGLIFSPPGAGNTGNFPVNINLINYPWLRSDWNQDGNFNNDTGLPEATISFGSYRGHDRVIYWRERFD
ncbi:hypothetical protein KFE80_10015 [bacterium SCSIO 12696]|nr:hypothetical protein KFE80_10015 [bacterium SCSIO 12696]